MTELTVFCLFDDLLHPENMILLLPGIRMGNESACRIVSIRDVWFTTSTGCKLLMKDVQHVSEVLLNLISSGRLDDAGYTGSI